MTDRFIVVWPYYAFMIFCTGFIGAKGDLGHGWECVKDKLLPTWKGAFCFWSIA